ncbi:E3 SUMO-protein ligase ZNF451 [Corythoichthys intestinalis]|uniref:E3 SUMO-protein ligase ZNF451 n=1 Tax=Corythoichthys intestinalis TaxID=161448 RepID=UPI0025A66BB0|nr:E3 SUMO-protein ligase ZNF451 [Corythoichthys intestinalis]XP_057704270.1 E3 SUMO-protein ligase ZNF451 [Corythoichthys intestinalis]
MSFQNQAEEDELDEVEFVSESQLGPELDCVDLLSDDSEEEGCSSSSRTIEDKVNRQKARVASTLDRLAQQVALEKRERADKCRAFKEKQIQQRVHGQQELALSSTNGINLEAKRCVDMWLKMPDPAVGSFGSGRRRRPVFPMNSSTLHTCPVINCSRVYENVSLLDGHLKRFDHSPCDPTTSLKGSPKMLFACVACCCHFQTKQEWRTHLVSKVSSSHPDGHCMSQRFQLIVCFACPACYLLFNLRDECLQHMSAKKHFTESLKMSDSKREAVPIPFPQHARNRLIALCRDTPFTVRCSCCQKVLTSHQAAQAHFNVNCRRGCAVATADETVVQVVKRLQVRGQCSRCCLIFLSQAEVDRHREDTKHEVEVNSTMERALLQHGRFNEQHGYSMNDAEKRLNAGVLIHTSETKSEKETIPAKRQKLRSCTTAWFCECGLRFLEETSASNHLLAVNQIFYQCGVCGKHMGESSITRLHMSRFHGGAHLSNFFFYCRKCKVEMPRLEDILSHVSDTHSGHTFFTEQEVPEDVNPSTSQSSKMELFSTTSTIQAIAGEAPPTSKVALTWMCRMCEDVFDSEAAVRKHCGDLSSHSFQKFVCGHCPQKFFKESTVRRHCANEHNGLMKSAYFCGLCDSMLFESEKEFLQHYERLHSKDYYCMENCDLIQPVESVTPVESCPCMSSDKQEGCMKAAYTRCMKTLASEGLCQYMCALCILSMPSYAQIKTHVNTTHAAVNLDKTFEVECQTCRERFEDVPKFHNHHHSQHCILEPCVSSRTCGKETIKQPQILNAVDGNLKDDCDEEVKKALALSAEDRETAELEEALQRSLLDF